MKRAITTIAIMALVIVCGYFSSACNSTVDTASSMTVVETTSAEDVEATPIVVETTSVKVAENEVCPEIAPESSHETVIMRDIEEATYRIWLPGDKPQTRWRCSKEVSNTFMLTEGTAVVEYNGILSSGIPDETGTVYVLANLASVSAIREICWSSELKGANKVVVCDISTYDTWFREFIERRIKTA